MPKVIEKRFNRISPLSPEELSNLVSIIPDNSACISGEFFASMNLSHLRERVVPQTQLSISYNQDAMLVSNPTSLYDFGPYRGDLTEHAQSKDVGVNLSDLVLGKLPQVLTLSIAGLGTVKDEIKDIKRILCAFTEMGYNGRFAVFSGSTRIIDGRNVDCTKGEDEFNCHLGLSELSNATNMFYMNNANHIIPRTIAGIKWSPEYGGKGDFYQQFEEQLKRLDFFKESA